MKIVVLGGAGLMGRITVRDLVESPQVTEVVVGELNRNIAVEVLGSLKSEKLHLEEVDVKDRKRLLELIKGSDVVINSTNYVLNLDVMQRCLEARAHYLDLGGLFHVTRRQLELHDDFLKSGLVAVLGCGSTPGITNVMAAYACENLDEMESCDVKIGCADFSQNEATLNAPYTMETILDEFSLNPAIFSEGDFKEVPPLSGEEIISFPEPVGKIRACYTLHSEVATFPLSFKGKGIKSASFRIAFPQDFYDKLKFLVELGFAKSEERKIKDISISLRKFILSIIEELPRGNGEPDDCDAIRVEARGKKGGRKKELIVESIVRPHSRWKVSAGALDTGVPASIVAQMIARGDVEARGVLPPEVCINPGIFFKELALREMNVYVVTREELF